MSTVAVALVLAVVVVVLVRLKAVRVWAAVVCGLAGFVLALTPLGDVVGSALGVAGGWMWERVAGL